MEQAVQYNLGNVDLSTVDCDEEPQTVHQYLRQVAAGRMRIPEIAYVERATIAFAEKPKLTPMCKRRDPMAPTKEWQHEKLREYRQNRDEIARLRELVAPSDIDWPSIYSPGEWLHRVLKKPNVGISEAILELFPQHSGTPPTPDVLFSLTNAQIESLVEMLVKHLVRKTVKQVQKEEASEEAEAKETEDNAKDGDMIDVGQEEPKSEELEGDTKDDEMKEVDQEESKPEEPEEESESEDEPEDDSHVKLTPALQHWLYALLLVLEKNYLHDVLASLRDLANFCRRGRAALPDADVDEPEELARTYSLFILIVAHHFEQKDLSD